MTTGQRIAQKRKEQNLSQESLGEQLGVSRQSVYKWESDTTLPEIDKLVALSRMFSVSLGWLIGVEEQESVGGELTETQIKMVEELAGRYAAVQRTEKPKSPWQWAVGITAAVVLAVGVWGGYSLSGQMRQLTVRYDETMAGMDTLKKQVTAQTGAVAAQIEHAVEEIQALKERHYNLTEDFSAGEFSKDLKTLTVDFYAWAVPKSETGEGIMFRAETEEGILEFPGERGKDGKYYARLTAPLTDSITVSMYELPGGKHEAQVLERFENMKTDSQPAVKIRGKTRFLWRELNDAG